MDELRIAYYGYVFDASGYGHAARAYIHALHAAGVGLRVVDLTGRAPQVRDPVVEKLVAEPAGVDVHLFHGIPSEWARRAFRLKHVIGMTVWETDAMPTQWRNVLNHALEVWLPCEFNREVFARELERPVFRLPHPVFPPRANGDVPPAEALLGVERDDFVFYSAFAWQERKGPRELLYAFLRAFPRDEAVALVLKTNPAAARLAADALACVRRETGSSARVLVHAAGWDEAELEALHRRGDCYVSLHRGEGWNYPLFEAASRGTPVVATAYSGPLDYLDAQHHALVRCQVGPVRQRYVYYSPRMRWAEPDPEHAAELMHGIFEQPEVARSRARTAAARIRRDYSPEAVGAAARARILAIVRDARPTRWQAATRALNGPTLRPPHPVPLDWYDEGYFETGLKSNWERGYSWSLFEGLFRDTAAFLLEMFPEAGSFLDAGCAKGFLVRALRERGKDAWGVDGSPWALAHAEPAARAYLLQGDVAALAPDRDYDILTAFNLLAHLTEKQAAAFLTRARPRTRTALLATIPTLEPGEDAARHKTDRDLSHVTLKSREWWRGLFLRAGWYQDPLHRTLERICQKHALPARMGWRVFLWVPGCRQVGP